MKLKSILYKSEQEQLLNQIINILELDNKNKQNKILELIPEIRKYYSFSTIIGASQPLNSKRPYLSIIRQLTKSKYKLKSYDYRIKQKEMKDIRTKKYIFELKNALLMQWALSPLGPLLLSILYCVIHFASLSQLASPASS